MEVNFAKLISEKECLQSISNDPSLEELEKVYLDPVFKKLMKTVAADICNAKLKDDHFYRFKIIVHAQKRENE